MFGWFKKKAPLAVPPKPQRDRLVPRIKSRKFLTALQELKIPEDQLPPVDPLVGDLVITYAYDLPETFIMASAESLAELGIERSDVKSIAVENLRRIMPKVEWHDHQLFFRIETGGSMEACSLLYDELWSQLREHYREDLVVAVPNRELVLWCLRGSKDGLQALRAIIPDAEQAAGPHGLTRELITWTKAGWQEYSSVTD